VLLITSYVRGLKLIALRTPSLLERLGATSAGMPINSEGPKSAMRARLNHDTDAPCF